MTSKKDIGPVQQDWVLRIPYMQQAVLFAAIRAPDGIQKNHPVKVLLRWYRRCILISAFEKRRIDNPFDLGGGSFTGPFTERHAQKHCKFLFERLSSQKALGLEDMQCMFDYMREVYLEHVDELPHHFQLHFLHAMQIVGCHHPVEKIAEWWKHFYLMIVNDAHLHPETDDEMNTRLSDNRDEWKKREVVNAK